MPRLIAERICKSFNGTPALSEVSFDVADGAFLALLGPSGCGKTTLLRLIAGLERPDSGRLRFDDRIMSDMTRFVPPEARGLGMVFQSYALWPGMTVRGNVEFALKVARLPRNERAARVAAALEVVGLRGLEDRRPHELSGGQRQRVALARSLAMRPRLILLDEPLANLDAHLRQSMLAEFRRIHSLTGATFLFVTHDQDEAMAVASQVAVMNAGRIEQIGAPEELYLRPATAMVARFIGRGETLPVEVLSSDGHRCKVALAGRTLDLPGRAAPGPAWLCLHRNDLAAVDSGGHLRAELLNQTFHNGAYHSQVLPLDAGAQTLDVMLPRRLPTGTRIGLALSGGWVIARDADAGGLPAAEGLRAGNLDAGGGGGARSGPASALQGAG